MNRSKCQGRGQGQSNNRRHRNTHCFPGLQNDWNRTIIRDEAGTNGSDQSSIIADHLSHIATLKVEIVVKSISFQMGENGVRKIQDIVATGLKSIRSLFRHLYQT